MNTKKQNYCFHLLLMFLLLLPSCGDDDDDDSADDDDDNDADDDDDAAAIPCDPLPVPCVWLETARFEGIELTSVWGTSNSDVFATTDMGGILHYDGVSWDEMEVPTMEPLKGIWAASSDNVFAVGSSGTILRFDGESWQKMTDEFDGRDGFSAINGHSSGNIYSIGRFPELIHFDDSSWSIVEDLPSDYSFEFYDVWFADSTTVFFSGFGGEAHDKAGPKQSQSFPYIYDGENWYSTAPPEEAEINFIWGTSRYDVFGLGPAQQKYNDGIRHGFWHYDGVQWLALPYSDSEDFPYLLDIWGVAHNRVFAVGDAGHAYHYDGSCWGRMETEPSWDLRAVWGASGDEVFAVGADSETNEGIVIHCTSE
jgi:hypothetical protein